MDTSRSDMTKSTKQSPGVAPSAPDLQTLEVKKGDVAQLVARCDEAAVLEMFNLGKALVDGVEKRFDNIVARGTTLIGFNGAILAFLLTSKVHVDGVFPTGCLIAGGVLAATSCVTAFIVSRVKSGWKEISEPVWFQEYSARAGAEELRRYYVRTLHHIHQINHRIVDDRTGDLGKAQLMTAAAAACLAAALIAGALS